MRIEIELDDKIIKHLDLIYLNLNAQSVFPGKVTIKKILETIKIASYTLGKNWHSVTNLGLKEINGETHVEMRNSWEEE